MFNVPDKFFHEEFPVKLKDIHEKKDLYIKRPPYQRKNIWPISKKIKFIDSLFRRYYIPRIILRQVTPKEGVLKFEVIDGQQRVNAIQDFYMNKFKTPNLDNIRKDISNKKYVNLPPDVQDFFDELILKATLIKGVDKPFDKKDQKLVTEIFWRLNDGMALTYIEKEHSKLYSAVRNFIVKYADDISFDSDKYKSINNNPNRHKFFDLICQPNNRLQNLALLARLLMIEFNGGHIDLKDKEMTEFVDRFSGVRLLEFENKKEVKNCLRCLDVLFNIFEKDKFKDRNGKLILFNREYFIISIYLLLRHLLTEEYNFGKEKYNDFRNFVDNFYKRWDRMDERDDVMFKFRDQRQQDKNSLIGRDVIIRKSFFKEYPDIEKLDPQRTFKTWQRIEIYQRDRGICKNCRGRIPWSNFDADHVVPRSKKGLTTVENGQLLCSHCNKAKGNILA